MSALFDEEQQVAAAAITWEIWHTRVACLRPSSQAFQLLVIKRGLLVYPPQRVFVALKHEVNLLSLLVGDEDRIDLALPELL